jgi:hypothetical protein
VSAGTHEFLEHTGELRNQEAIRPLPTGITELEENLKVIHGLNDLGQDTDTQWLRLVFGLRTESASVEGEGVVSRKPNARLPPSGVTACGVLWVEPGDPMTRRPSSIVLI